MDDTQLQTLRQRLEWVLITFFALTTLSLVVIYVTDPAIYAQVLLLEPDVSSAYPLPVVLFLVGLLVFIALLIVGIRRHWRWVFWLILVAFGAAVLDILAAPLQLVGVFPEPYPLWYNLFRLGISCAQVVIAVWMGRIAYRHGAWALGKQKQADLTDEQSVA
ncbi:MAG TPA: hypothetical protein VH599_16210 [Ktedonobacterales bacterium]|jgi:cell division protein FtsW (lipid II flippase)